jgi:AhpD family alkylhydroperoxidase
VRTASEAWHSLVVEPSSLPRWIKEAVVVITCSAQQTPYCVEGHSHALRRERLDERQIESIQTRSFEGFSDPELSIFRFAHKAAASPKSLGAEDYRRLEALGLSKATILEILGVVWANTAMNMIVDALGVTRTARQKEELRIG